MNVIPPSAAVEGIALGYSFSVSCNINYVFIVGTSIGSGDGLTRFEKSDVPFWHYGPISRLHVNTLKPRQSGRHIVDDI